MMNSNENPEMEQDADDLNSARTSSSGEERQLPHEAWHVVQEKPKRVKRKRIGSQIDLEAEGEKDGAENE